MVNVCLSKLPKLLLFSVACGHCGQVVKCNSTALLFSPLHLCVNVNSFSLDICKPVVLASLSLTWNVDTYKRTECKSGLTSIHTRILLLFITNFVFFSIVFALSTLTWPAWSVWLNYFFLKWTPENGHGEDRWCDMCVQWPIWDSCSSQ